MAGNSCMTYSLNGQLFWKSTEHQTLAGVNAFRGEAPPPSLSTLHSVVPLEAADINLHYP